MNILIIDDDRELVNSLSDYLEKSNFVCDAITENFDKILTKINFYNTDLILLDWLLPNRSGIDICNQIRSNNNTKNIIIIMISVRTQLFEKIYSLNNGVDDYIPKPFSKEELLAKIKSFERRINNTYTNDELTYKDIAINLNKHIIFCKKKEIYLRPIELKILKILIENSEKVVTRNLLINKVWGTKRYINDRTIDVQIKRLRDSLNIHFKNENIIKTVRSVGYKLYIR